LTCGLLPACASCPTPGHNLNLQLRPSWNNIHDTFPTGIEQDTTPEQITQFVNDEKCNFSTMTMWIVVEISTKLLCTAGGHALQSMLHIYPFLRTNLLPLQMVRFSEFISLNIKVHARITFCVIFLYTLRFLMLWSV